MLGYNTKIIPRNDLPKTYEGLRGIIAELVEDRRSMIEDRDQTNPCDLLIWSYVLQENSLRVSLLGNVFPGCFQSKRLDSGKDGRGEWI